VFQNLIYGKHLIKYPEQKPSLDKEKFLLNNSLVIISWWLYPQVHWEPPLLSFGEREKNNFCPQKYGMSIVNREVIVEREGRGEKQWINLNR